MVANGYIYVHQIRENRAGGVSLFIDSSIKFNTRDDLKIDLADINLLCIEIPKDELHAKRNIVIVSVYRPTSVCSKRSR